MSSNNGEPASLKRAIVAVGSLACAALVWIVGQTLFHMWQENAVLREPMKGRLMRLRVPSRALRRTNTLFVYLPPGYESRKGLLPVVYLLHGCPGRGIDWFVKGRAHSTAERLILDGKIGPVVLVSFDGFGPNGPTDTTEFLNSARGGVQVEDYVAHELPRQVERRFRVTGDRWGRALIGLSAGGYGAVNIGTKHRGIFGAIGSHSGYFDPRLDAEHVRRMLGPEGPLWKENSPIEQVDTWTKGPAVHVYLDVGESDELLRDNKMLAARMSRDHIDHEFVITTGGHHWYVWRRQLRESLQYVDAVRKAMRAEDNSRSGFRPSRR